MGKLRAAAIILMSIVCKCLYIHSTTNEAEIKNMSTFFNTHILELDAIHV